MMAINFSLSKLPWYGQVGVFLVLAGGAVGGFWNYYARPAQAEIDTRLAALTQVRGEINRGLTTARRLPEFRKEVATLELQLDRLRAVLPEERDVADLLNRINSMATQSNLKILAYIPATMTKKTLHSEWPIGLRLEGSYHDMGTFLERISKFPRVINVGDMRLRAREAQTTRTTVTVDVTATTFVLAEQPKPAAPAGAPRPGGA
jgi:type IV pilus assembly protein PilO